MSVHIEKETELVLNIPYQDIAEKVITYTLDSENCPYEAEINLLLTDNEEIANINSQYRQIERATDVLSFPLLEYQVPGDLSHVEDHEADYFEPETGELMLGDIIVSVEKIYEQAEAYGHSAEREYAFLLVHSVLHLLGYDHIDKEDAELMERKQKEILESLQITR